MPHRVIGRHADLLREARDFRLLFVATAGSGLGTMLAVIALTVDVYERTGSGKWVSALLIADFLPTIAIGLLLGPLVDRLPRRSLMIASDLARMAAFVALVFAPSAAAVVALALVVGIGNGFFRPAAYAGMPNLVRPSDLPRANSLFQATENLMWMLGPVAGGVLLKWTGPEIPYLVNAATFVVSALFVYRIPRHVLAVEGALSRGHWRDLAEGFGTILRSRALLTVAVAWTIVMFGNAAINVSEVFLVRDALGGSNAALGLMMGGAGLGLVVGSLLAAPLLETRPIAAIYGIALVLMAIGFGGAALSPSVAVALPFVILAGVGNGGAVVCNPLLVQWGAPDRVRGRAFTAVMSLNFAFLALGMMLAGPLTDLLGPRWLWGAAAAILVVAAAIGAALARGVTPAEEPETPEPPLPAQPARVGAAAPVEDLPRD